MASLVTGIIGGFQQRSAVSNAEKDQIAAALKAAGIVDAATGEVNPQILEAATNAIAGRQAASDTAIEGVSNATTSANARLDPYSQAGSQSLSKIIEMTQNPETFEFEKDPGYDFRQAEQMKGLERSAAARGSALGGAALKAAMRFSGDYASNEYDKAFQRWDRNRTVNLSSLSGLAGMGFDAARLAGSNELGAAQYGGNMGVDTATYAGNVRRDAVNQTSQNTLNAAGFRANTEMDIGDARAAAHMGRANAWSGMLNQLGKTGDAVLSGGFSGGGGFNWRRGLNAGMGVR